MLNKLEDFAKALQDAHFGLELTLDLNTGEIEQSDEMGVEEVLYIATGGGYSEPDFTHSGGIKVECTKYAPFNYMSLGTLRHHISNFMEEEELANYSKLVAQLSMVDVDECMECDEDGMTEWCDHMAGWAVLTTLSH